MNSLEYCYQQAAPLGSTFYYSVKKNSLAVRNAIVAIQAFYQELENILFSYTDVGVAQVKFNWWRDEVIKIRDGQPTHPVSLALQPSIDTFHLPSLKLIEMIDGMEQNLSPLSFSSFEEVVIYFMRTAGVRECLIAAVSQCYEEEIIYQGMLVVELVNLIQNFRRYQHRDLMYFATDELRQFPDIKKLLHYQAEKVERAYVKMREQSTPKIRLGLSSLRIRVEIAHALCKEIEASNFPVLQQFIDLTPLRKWWIAMWC